MQCSRLLIASVASPVTVLCLQFCVEPALLPLIGVSGRVFPKTGQHAPIYLSQLLRGNTKSSIGSKGGRSASHQIAMIRGLQ